MIRSCVRGGASARHRSFRSCAAVRSCQPFAAHGQLLCTHGRSQIQPSPRFWSATRPLSSSSIDKQPYSETFGAITQTPIRTHTCGELRQKNSGEEVVVCGWSNGIRSINDNLAFLPLRDAYGVVQLCAEGVDMVAKLKKIGVEDVCAARGIVRERPPANVNEKMLTGDIEILLTEFSILNKAENLPYPIGSKISLVNEDLRLKYRHIDLRREAMQANLRRRSEAVRAARDVLYQYSFVEVETPILFKSTPEGAREFLVPTRQPNRFFALPQSPQQCKQLLMAGGLDRYFQIARCFRDEDLRADRQPEFTQIDIEMSFATKESIYQLIESILASIWLKVANVTIPTPFRRMQFQEAIARYGSDKPDLRYGLEIQNADGLLTRPDLKEGDLVFEVLQFPSSAFTTNDVKKLIHEFHPDAKWGAIKGTRIEGPLREFMQAARAHVLQSKYSSGLTESSSENVFVGVARSRLITNGTTLLGRLRTAVSASLIEKGMLSIDPDQLEFLWVENFPLFSPVAQPIATSSSAAAPVRNLESTHHPFTAPEIEDLPLLTKSPEKVRGQHYDVVLNGVELGGGSIRIHNPRLQEFVFREILKLNEDETNRFSHLLEALGHGCPPHGGIALGLDRLVAILCKASSLRDVIAFPKNSKGRDMVIDAPSFVSDDRLLEYHIRNILSSSSSNASS